MTQGPRQREPIGTWRVVLNAASIYLGRDRRSNVRRLATRAIAILRDSGFSGLRAAVASRLTLGTVAELGSQSWPEQDRLDTDTAKRLLTSEDDTPAYTPTFSLLAAVRNPNAARLSKCLEAIKAQLYPRWELCIAYDDSTSPEIRALLERYGAEESRINVVHPSPDRLGAVALQSAFGFAKGEFIAIIDPDDELSPNALPHYVLALNQHRDADLIYGDEDRVDDAGKHSAPCFKPDWSPETLLNDMYLGHSSIYRRSLVQEVDPFRRDMGSAQEYDLALRVTERTARIHHISRVLCHRHIGQGGTASDTPATPESCQRTLEALRLALVRRHLRGSVESHARFPDHHIVHLAADLAQKVSIVVPTRDRADLLERCLESVFGLSTYPNFDVCVVDNGSTEQSTFEVLERFERLRPGRFSVIRRDIPFNFPALVNAGVAATDGDLVLLLNNDTEVLDGAWLDEMAGYAQRPDIGAVGCVLLYPDGTVQHGGVTLITGAVACNNHVNHSADAPGYFGRLLAQSNYAAVTGACLMVRREVFLNAGGFDERLAVSYNDVDFCLRVLGRGYRNVCLGQVRLLHHESRSRGSDDAADRRPRAIAEFGLMRERWASILDNDPYYSPNLRGIPPGNEPAESTPRWVGSSSPVLLVAGHSHTYSFLDYLERSGQRARLAVLDSASNNYFEPDSYWSAALSEARERRLPLAIVWHGNQHNANFLLESDERFSIFPATGPWEDGYVRPLIPRSLIRAFFAPTLWGLREVLAKSDGVRVIIFGTPPPKADDQIEAAIHRDPWLAEWAERLGVTGSMSRITPLPIRLELWKVAQDLLRAMADEFAVTFIRVPETAFPGGALSADASAPDATHANGVWAKVMIQEAAEAMAAR